jgi:hypothetical protein
MGIESAFDFQLDPPFVVFQTPPAPVVRGAARVNGDIGYDAEKVAFGSAESREPSIGAGPICFHVCACPANAMERHAAKHRKTPTGFV